MCVLIVILAHQFGETTIQEISQQVSDLYFQPTKELFGEKAAVLKAQWEEHHSRFAQYFIQTYLGDSGKGITARYASEIWAFYPNAGILNAELTNNIAEAINRALKAYIGVLGLCMIFSYTLIYLYLFLICSSHCFSCQNCWIFTIF